MATINLTEAQDKAWWAMETPIPHVFLYGGARSGKSYVIALWIIEQSLKHPGIRTLIARSRFSHARTSIWHQTVLGLLHEMRIPRQWRENRTEFYISFSNGSEIWLGGFDEKERTEKLLGHEYAMVYFNEISQIGFDAVELGLTRLAQKVTGFNNRAFYDCNPPSPLHWSHRLFIEKVNPKEPKRAMACPDDYFCLRLNPIDNKENLPEGFFKTLSNLSDRTRRRMELGEWVKAEGVVYERFTESMVVKESQIPPIEEYTVGVDFGLHMAAVLVGWAGDNVYVLDDYSVYDIPAREFNAALKARWGDKMSTVYCDPSGGERLQEITNSVEANNSVDPGIDCINEKMAQGRFFVCDKAMNVLSEIGDYRREVVTTRQGMREVIVKQNDHACLIGRTRIRTKHGYKRLDRIKVGDRVMTRKGPKRVTISACTNEKADIMIVKLSNGIKLYGTRDHPVCVKGKGFISIDSLRYGDILETWKDNEWKKSFTKESLTKDTPIQKDSPMRIIIDPIRGIYEMVRKRYTGKYTLRNMGLSLKTFVYIIGTVILPIIRLKISGLFLKANILNYMVRINLLRKKEHISKWFGHLLHYGMGAKREKDGMKNTEKMLSSNVKRIGRVEWEPVSYAVKLFIRGIQDRNIVIKTVKQRHCVYVVSTKNTKKRKPVYNLLVENTHEYYANDVLVSNCDALRYAIFSRIAKPLQIFV